MEDIFSGIYVVKYFVYFEKKSMKLIKIKYDDLPVV